MLKKILVFIIALTLAAPVAFAASTSVKGYRKKDGTYVQPHKRTAPNSRKSDNWSTKGNTNPYTGKDGTVDPYQKNKRK